MRGRQVLQFIDNNSAKDALIRGWSAHPASEGIVRAVWEQEMELQTATWYERVPSDSNPADEPSRGALASLEASGARRVQPRLPAGWAQDQLREFG